MWLPLADVSHFMSGDPATCQHDASPDAALAAVCAHEGPVLVDFDETLYLRNSTEDFIDCAARPIGINVAAGARRAQVMAANRWHRYPGNLSSMCHFDLFPWTRWRILR
jgi:hypothetical protein